jgi:hypothetical protein
MSHEVGGFHYTLQGTSLYQRYVGTPPLKKAFCISQAFQYAFFTWMQSIGSNRVVSPWSLLMWKLLHRLPTINFWPSFMWHDLQFRALAKSDSKVPLIVLWMVHFFPVACLRGEQEVRRPWWAPSCFSSVYKRLARHNQQSRVVSLKIDL